MVSVTPPAERSLGVLGVPTSAGSHNAGQEDAPAALRTAGLLDRLREHGVEVHDHGDSTRQRHRPVDRVDGVRDLARVVDVARECATAVEQVARQGQVPVVLGGDCTVTLGVVAGLRAAHDTEGSGGGSVGLAYVDGDADLNTPGSSGTGVLDSMGVSHLLGEGAPGLASLGPEPLLRPEQLVLVGFDPDELDTGQWVRLVEHRLWAEPAPLVRKGPRASASRALEHLEADHVLVHLDVDVLHTGLFPLANFPHFGGLRFDEVMELLATICADDRFAGLVLTEVAPAHDPDGSLLDRLVRGVAAALSGAP